MGFNSVFKGLSKGTSCPLPSCHEKPLSYVNWASLK